MAVCVMGCVCVFLYAGIIFNTRAVVECVFCGAGCASYILCGFTFFYPCREWGGCVCGMACMWFLYTGIIFNTRAVVGYVVVCGVVKFPLLLWVYFFLPVSWVGCVFCGVGRGFIDSLRVLFLIPVWLWSACSAVRGATSYILCGFTFFYPCREWGRCVCEWGRARPL